MSKFRTNLKLYTIENTNFLIKKLQYNIEIRVPVNNNPNNFMRDKTY